MMPVTLVILDGWGIAPLSLGNAIERARTPTMDHLLRTYPSCALHASGEAVGLPYGEMGNSEVGHLTIGLGRIHYQPLPRITRSIIQRTFFTNATLLNAMRRVRERKSRLHLIGLISTGGVHGYLDHCFALLEMAKQQEVPALFLHAITDGRDAPSNSSIHFLERIEERIYSRSYGKIASVMGRFWAMDRDNRWDRTKQAFNAMIYGKSEHVARSARTAIQGHYNNGVYDEHIPPTVIVNDTGGPMATVDPDDVVISFNFRSDRMRQLIGAIALPVHSAFDRGAYTPPLTVTFTQYDPSFPCPVAFPNEPTNETLSEIVSQRGLRQLHIAETEKYAHVTYFLNGYVERPFPGEDRMLIPSPLVHSYQTTPEMSAIPMTESLREYWRRRSIPALSVVNYANADMVGHTGDFEATRRAIEIIDECLGALLNDAIRNNQALLITGDHGNAEEMVDGTTHRPNTSHSTNPVPFILAGNAWQERGSIVSLSARPPIYGLSSVAPTVLELLDIPPPSAMNHPSLLPTLL